MAEQRGKALVPQIRFAGFTDPWEQRKLGELSNEFKSGEFICADNVSVSGPYPVYGGNGLRGYTTTFNHEGLYTLIGRQGALCGNVNIADGKSYFTEHAVAVKANHLNDTTFLYYLFGTLDLGQYSGQSAQPGLAVSNLVEVEAMVPDKAEQKKISRVFKTVDSLITLHQRKYDKLCVLKKSMLDKMFPKGGSLYPQIRFAGFTDPWEQRKLGELCSFSKGCGYSKNDLRDQGTPIILYGRLYTNYETQIHSVDTFVKPLENSVYSEGGEVIIPASGETAEDISIASVVEKPGIILGGDLNVITSSADIDPVFLALELSYGKPHFDLAKRAQGKSVVHIHNEDIANVFFGHPNIAEQRRIGAFFDRLDSLITLHQRKYDGCANPLFLERRISCRKPSHQNRCSATTTPSG